VAAAAGGFIRSIFQARGKLDDDEQYCGNYAFAGSRAHEIAPRAEKNGMRCVMIELRNEEIEALIRKQLLKPEMRNDREAIAAEGPEAAPPALAPVACATGTSTSLGEGCDRHGKQKSDKTGGDGAMIHGGLRMIRGSVETTRRHCRSSCHQAKRRHVHSRR
jgi:hypothetical protein